jgi:hypothetical protein
VTGTVDFQVYIEVVAVAAVATGIGYAIGKILDWVSR